MEERGDVPWHGHKDHRGPRAVPAPGSSVGFSHPGLSVQAGDRQPLLAEEQQGSTPVWLRPSKLIPPHEGSLFIGVHKARQSPSSEKRVYPGQLHGLLRFL